MRHSCHLSSLLVRACYLTCVSLLARSYPAVNPATRPSAFAQSFGGPSAQPEKEEGDKYVINIKQIAKFVVGLGDKVAPTDVEEGMRVG